MTTAELALTVTFLGSAYLLFKLAGERIGQETETGDGPDFIRLMYLMVGFMFVLGGLFTGGKIAASNGYPGVKNVLDWGLTAGLIVFTLLGGFLLWDFVSVVLKQFKSSGLDDSDWGW